MALSCLFPIAGIMKQVPLELSMFMGGLLFLTSLGSYVAKRMRLRIFSWMAYTVFIVFLLTIWNQYVTISSLTANAKIAACIAVVPFLFRFRTYAITVGLLGLWGALLWDVNQTHSLAVLQRMMNLTTTERLYLFILIGGFLFGGWLGNATNSEIDREKQEKISRTKQKKKRKRLRFTIPVPSLPKLKIKILNSGRKSSVPQETRMYVSNDEDNTIIFNPTQTETQAKGTLTEGQTRMERRKKRYNA
jgi:hypothetical protein